MIKNVILISAVFSGLLGRCAILAAPGGPAAATISETTVHLPPYFATAESLLRWRYVAIPGFEILSCCTDDVTEAFAKEVCLNQDLLDALVPLDLQARDAVPTTLILLSKDQESRMSQKVASIVEEGRKRLNEQLDRMGLPTSFNGHNPIPQIMLRDADSSGANIVGDRESNDFKFTPEYLFFALNKGRPSLPLWFIEGILNFRYRNGSDNFNISGSWGRYVFDGRASEINPQVEVSAAFWISADADDYVRAHGNDKNYDVGNPVLPPLRERMLALRKLLAEGPWSDDVPVKKPFPARQPLALWKALAEPPAAGPNTGSTGDDAQMLSLRTLLAGSPPPSASDRAKDSWLARARRRGTDDQVQYVLSHGADEDSPWRLDLWRSQAPLFVRLVFDGLSLRKLLTEPPPPPGSDQAKELWLARADREEPPGESPGFVSDTLKQQRRVQYLLAHGADKGSPWRLDIWKSQAALFVRWAFDDDTHARRKALWKLASLARFEPVTEAVFKDCFGVGFDEINDRLFDYLQTALTDRFVLIPRDSIEISYLQLSNPTDAEKARILGDWERKEIDSVRASDPGYADKYIEQAGRTLMGAYEKGARDPGLLAALGLYDCTVGDDARARNFLEAAVQGQVVRPSAYVELARIRLAAALAKPAGVGGKLGREQAASVLNLLQSVQSQQPPQLMAFSLTVQVWEHAATLPTHADLAALNERLPFLSADPPLILDAAWLDARAGLKAEAIRLLDSEPQAASDPATRRRFDALRAKLVNSP